MIKKSLFEQELEAGMQQELRKMASGDVPDLVKAAECLHAAIEIFEEAGLQSRADALLQILEKIAQDNQAAKNVVKFPSAKRLAEMGFTEKDMAQFHKGDPRAVGKLNVYLRNFGLSEQELKSLLKDKYMDLGTAYEMNEPGRNFGKIWDWMKDPTMPIDPNNPQPGETITMSRVPSSQFTPMPGDEISYKSLVQPTAPATPDDKSLEFKSIAGGPRKPKNPTKVSDRHTKGLTPEKMIANLKHHGTEFNMASDAHAADDINSGDLDPEVAYALGVDRVDDLNVDIPQDGEFEDDWLKWKEMTGQEEPVKQHHSPRFQGPAKEHGSSPTMFGTPKGWKTLEQMKMEDIDDSSDFNVDDDVLEVTDEVPLEDFEDERH